jgi:integrase
MYLVPTVGSITLAKLTPAHVSRMLISLEGRGYAPEPRRKARANLRRALRRAEQEGIVTRNVAAIADGPRVPRREGRTLTPDQAKTFLNAVKGDRLETAYIVALALGLRRGELLGISWGDLELDSPCRWCAFGASSCATKVKASSRPNSRRRAAGARCTSPGPSSRR